MKLPVIVFVIGLILLYFANIAFLKTTSFFDTTWFFHSWSRFLIGFLVLGVLSFYAENISFKRALQIILILDVIDYIYDFSTGAYRMQLEIIMHGVYMLTWGALTGYCTAKSLKNKMTDSD